MTASFGGDVTGLELKNYPRSGPMISGPHITLYICQTDQYVLPDGATLVPARDGNCSAPTNIQYEYKSSADGTFKPMRDITTLPGDAATTAILTGATVPYVVRPARHCRRTRHALSPDAPGDAGEPRTAQILQEDAPTRARGTGRSGSVAEIIRAGLTASPCPNALPGTARRRWRPGNRTRLP